MQSDTGQSISYPPKWVVWRYSERFTVYVYRDLNAWWQRPLTDEEICKLHVDPEYLLRPDSTITFVDSFQQSMAGN